MIDLISLSLQFGGKVLFDDLNYKINAGDKISLVGANGTGKSSLLKIINGELSPESGKIAKQKNISIGYLPQDNVTHSGKTVLEEARSALTDIIFLREKEENLTDLLNQDLPEDEKLDYVNQLGEVHLRLEELDSYKADSEVEKILIGLGFEEEDFPKLTNHLSGGWQMRLALAKILISQNDILLLDEPTNHLDIDSLEWLIKFLKGYTGALLLVSHDKYFVNEVTNKTLEIFLNKVYTFKGTYDDYLKYKDERDELIYNQAVLQQKKIAETEKFIERFRYKASKARQVQSRVKQLEKVELIQLPEEKEDIYIRFPEAPPSGRINIELTQLHKSYGNNVIFSGIDFTLERGEKIAFVGPNGAGKTTLAKIIAGEIEFNSGQRNIGHNTIISYYAQDVADKLNPELNLLESVDGIAENKTPGQLRSLLGSFLFTGDDVFKKVKVLSGGEKSRLALAKILLAKSNFIILDEPTNHLDISSKEVLQQALIDFSGSLILVSHDVDFLKPVVNKVIEIRRSSFKTYYGGIEYYLEKREEEKIEAENEEKKNVKNESLNRKEQKRIEAEIRQKKYAATKDLQKKLKVVEEKIDTLEKRNTELEALLFDSSIYDDREKAKTVNDEFNDNKQQLEKLLLEWEDLSSKIMEIEEQISKL